MSELLTPEEIADMLKVSPRIVKERVLRSPDFPRPAVDLSQKCRRWSKMDVDAWIARSRETSANPA